MVVFSATPDARPMLIVLPISLLVNPAVADVKAVELAVVTPSLTSLASLTAPKAPTLYQGTADRRNG